MTETSLLTGDTVDWKKEDPEFRELEKSRILAETGRHNAEAAVLTTKAQHMAIEFNEFGASAHENLIYSFYGPVLAPNVRDCIKNLDLWSRKNPGKEITIILNSPGGSVTDGFALYDFIEEVKRRGSPVVIKGMGMVASMGSILLQAGTKRIMSKNAMMMLHEAAGGIEGSIAEMTDSMNLFKKYDKKALDVLTERSTLTGKAMKLRYNRKDYWLDAEEALEIGLVDDVE